jgi:hypothetical protein
MKNLEKIAMYKKSDDKKKERNYFEGSNEYSRILNGAGQEVIDKISNQPKYSLN